MPSRAVHLTASIKHLAPEDQEAWSTWLAQHNIDPNRVALGHALICDDQANTISYTAPEMEDGRWTTRLVTEVVQLEAPALPYPASPYSTEDWA